MNKKRRASIRKIHDKLSELMESIEQLKYEEQEAFDNLPDSVKESDRGSVMIEAADNLDYASGSIEDAIAQLEAAMNC